MPATLRKLLTLVPVSLVFSIVCWGQTTSLEGTVKGEDGKPLVGAVIQINRTDIKASYTVKTDKKGHYFHAGLPIGVFNVAVAVDGQVKDQVNGVRTKLGDAIPVDFDLKSAAASTVAKGPATTGGAAAPNDATRGMSAKDKEEYEKKVKDQSAQLAKNKALNDAFNTGKEAMAAKNYDAAVTAFQSASELDPAQHVIWANLADAYSTRSGTKTGADQQADLDKSLEGYKKALEIKPDDSGYLNNYALTLVRSKKFDEAQTELNKAAQLDPTNAGKYYYNLGAVLVNSGQLDAAGDVFKKAVAADPNYADAHYQYGVYLIGKATVGADGKIVPPPGTQEELQKYLELQPTGPNADAAKAMLQSMGATVETQFNARPGQKAPAPGPATNTKKKN